MDISKMINQEIAKVTNSKVTIAEELKTIDHQVEAHENLLKKFTSDGAQYKKNGNYDQFGKALAACAEVEGRIAVLLNNRATLDPTSPRNRAEWLRMKGTQAFAATVVGSAKAGAVIGAGLAPVRAAIMAAKAANTATATIALMAEQTKSENLTEF